MRFISIRELRSNSEKLREYLKKDENVVLTLKGKPLALIRAVSDESLEDELMVQQQARAIRAVARARRRAAESGQDQMSMEEINRRIAQIRKERKRTAAR